MKDLRYIKKLELDGKYKYVGFMLLTEPQFAEDNNIIGTQLLFFKALNLSGKDVSEKEDFYFVVNTEIFESSTEKPYGMFQSAIGTFNSNYDIDIIMLQEKLTYYIEDKDKPKAEVIEDKK